MRAGKGSTRKGSGRVAGLAALLVMGLLVVLAGAVVLAGPQLLARTLPAAPLAGESEAALALAQRQRAERELLNSYGWVDKDAGVARIPVSEAVQRIAEEGLPVGAPESVVLAATTETEAIPEVVSFQEHVLPIFVERCGECHGDDEPEEGLEVTSYRALMLGSIYGSVIKAGDVEGSYLFEQINTGKMPKRGGPLTPTQIEIVRQWIEAGALDN